MSRDVTERKRAAETIELLSRRNEMILKSAGEGICGIDLDGLITFVNPAAVRMTGWTIDELIGKSQHEVLHHSLWDGAPHRREDCRIHASMKDGARPSGHGRSVLEKGRHEFPGRICERSHL